MVCWACNSNAAAAAQLTSTLRYARQLLRSSSCDNHLPKPLLNKHSGLGVNRTLHGALLLVQQKGLPHLGLFQLLLGLCCLFLGLKLGLRLEQGIHTIHTAESIVCVGHVADVPALWLSCRVSAETPACWVSTHGKVWIRCSWVLSALLLSLSVVTALFETSFLNGASYRID